MTWILALTVRNSLKEDNDLFHLIAARNAGGIADFIQPSLVQLQPNLEDFMDTLEPLQGKENVVNITCV
jgi:hypothetical protein